MKFPFCVNENENISMANYYKGLQYCSNLADLFIKKLLKPVFK